MELEASETRTINYENRKLETLTFDLGDTECNADEFHYNTDLSKYINLNFLNKFFKESFNRVIKLPKTKNNTAVTRAVKFNKQKDDE